MKVSLCVVLSLAVLMTIFLPAIESAAARRRGGRQRSGAAARRRFPQVARRGRQNVRRGRQEMEAAAADAAAADGEEAEAIDPIACDPKAPQGGFLNFANWQAKCVEKGYTDFGNYVGLPLAKEEEDEDAPAEE